MMLKKNALPFFTLQILKIVGTATVAVIQKEFLSRRRYESLGSSIDRLWRSGGRSQRQPDRLLLSVTLHRLKKNGLVAKAGKTRYAAWRITERGSDALQSKHEELPKEDGVLRIVMFDIPEKERAKRALLRARLAACEYHIVQKSVWLGKRPLPDSFFEEVKRLGVLRYLHIIEVSKRGTITEV